MKNTSKILALVLVVMTLLMSLSAITASAVEVKEFVFDVTTLTAEADKEKIADGTPYDEFFTFVGDGTTKRWSSSKGVYAAEINKKSQSGIQFTIPEGAIDAKVVVSFASTGGSNLSLLNILDSTGAALGADKEVTGTADIDAEYALTAGTYKIVAPSSDRGTRISKVVVTYGVETCAHEGGEATCAQQAICSKCSQPYGELSTEHNFANGVCTVCGTPDPNACAHENMAPATCVAPKTCECGYTEGEALGHDMIPDAAVAPTCTEKGLEAGEHCSRCDHKVEQKEIAALGHTLTFVNTLPTAEAAGKTIADCSVCGAHLDFGEVNVMTGGTYVLDAAKLAGIAQYSLFDGEVKIVDGVFACHLSYKYRTDENVKTFAADDWTSTHRMNFGGKPAFCNNGEDEEAVPNGGLMNFVQIVTTGTTTVTIHWNAGGAGREVAIYDMEGNILHQSNENPEDNKFTCVTTFELPAGQYLIGNVVNQNYWHKVTVEVEAPHTHNFADATCTEPAKCECGETQGEALGHDFAEGVCTRCEAADPEYVAPEEPKDEAPAVPKLNFFQKVLAWFMEFIQKLVAFFKK